jgi:hypothetical protein
MRDRKVRQAFYAHPRYHRLDLELDGEEPKLDDVINIPGLKSKVQGDRSMSAAIDDIARCVVASLFYFELDAIPQRDDGKYIVLGRVLCSLRRHDPAFKELFDQLSSTSARFYLDEGLSLDWSLIATVKDPSCFDKDGNLRINVEFNATDRFTILLQQRSSDPYRISGSPFSVGKLIQAQGLDASFGRPDHRKRKASEDLENPNKRQKCT